jgi:hypothetical protein
MVTGLILFATIKQFQISFLEVDIIPSTIRFWTREYTSRSLIACWCLFASLKWLRFIRPMHSNPCIQHHEKTDTKTSGSHNTQQLFQVVGVKNVVLLLETGGPWKWRIDTMSQISHFHLQCLNRFTKANLQQQCILCHKSEATSWLLHVEHSLPESLHLLVPAPSSMLQRCHNTISHTPHYIIMLLTRL